MIKANELRVGNSIYDRHGNYIYIQNGWFYIVQDIKRLEDYSPIPLTPEILEKCGFIEKTNREWVIGENPVTQDYVMVVRYSPIIDGFYFLNGHFKLKYLHQLQNLYFALTGEELIINL